jgi:hypothetical protein
LTVCFDISIVISIYFAEVSVARQNMAATALYTLKAL